MEDFRREPRVTAVERPRAPKKLLRLWSILLLFTLLAVTTTINLHKNLAPESTNILYNDYDQLGPTRAFGPNRKQQPQAIPSFLPPPSEWFGDIATNISSLGCGIKKCAFHSLTSQLEKSTTPFGYLVSQENDERGHFGMDLAEDLSEMFSIQHTLLAYPHTTDFTCTEEISNRLNSVLPRNVPIKRFETKKALRIQPIQLLSEPTLIFKCHGYILNRAKRTVELLPHFPLYHLDSEQFLAFEERLRSDLRATVRMMEAPEATCLRYDFQVYVDVRTGAITHLDFERCYEEEPVNYAECFSRPDFEQCWEEKTTEGDKKQEIGTEWSCAATLEGFVKSIIVQQGATVA